TIHGTLVHEVTGSTDDLTGAQALGCDAGHGAPQVVWRQPAFAQANADPVGVVDDGAQRLIELVRQRSGHLAHRPPAKHVREVRLVLAHPFLARAQLRRPRGDSCLELLVQAADLLLGTLPRGDVLTDEDDAERLIAHTAEAPDVPQDDARL